MPRRRRPTFSGTRPPQDHGTYSMSVPRSVIADTRRDSLYGEAHHTPSSDDDLMDHRDSRHYSSTGFVDRWIRRNSIAAARVPLLDAEQGIDDQGNPVDSHPLDGPTVFDYSDHESLKSKPSTRRSSIDSSIDDVCMPLDSPVEDSVRISSRRVWPDYGVLNDFVVKELKDQAETEAAELVNHGLRDRFAVNEAEEAGPLRPPRYVPWMKSSKFKCGTSMFDQYRGSRAGTYRYTYFRDDLPATIHSPSISGLLQPGQDFEELFPPVIVDPTPPPRGSSVAPAGSSVSAPAATSAAAMAGANGATAAGGAAGTVPSGTTGYTGPPSVVVPPPMTADVPLPAQAAAQMSEPRSTTPLLPPQKPSSITPLTLGDARDSPRPEDKEKAKAAAEEKLHRVTSRGGSVGGHASHASHASHAGAPLETPIGSPRLSEALSLSQEPRGPFWLDILDPTEEEMRVISKAFGVHPLTTEDILLKETREKVELFHNYYFICFTSFDVDNGPSKKSRSRRPSTSNQSLSSVSSSRNPRSDKLRPLAIYTIVFHTGVITVHYKPTPHTINVRRRIRLLKDYLNLSSDWISYALIDDITDGFAPMIAAIEEDVTHIEDAILQMNGTESDWDNDSDDDNSSSSSSSGSSSTGYRQWRAKRSMLRMIGESRKRVMGLLGLLGNKADVIKGFSKRVTEQWSGAPRSEIALYLSDIQDHLVTMVQSLNHYEKLLARSHSNYLAQINIDMTKANNDMNDVLGKISVLGTIVLPMNIVTGLWGMNVLVPGQGNESSLVWFWGIVVSMAVGAVIAYFILKRFV